MICPDCERESIPENQCEHCGFPINEDFLLAYSEEDFDEYYDRILEDIERGF